MHWVARGTGTPEDRDEVNSREFWLCDGLVCDLETIGVPSIFNIIRNTEVLTRMWSTLHLSCEENTVRRKWKLVCTHWTPEVGRKRSVSRWACKNRKHTNSLCRLPDGSFRCVDSQTRNNRYKGNRVRGTIIIISKFLSWSVSISVLSMSVG